MYDFPSKNVEIRYSSLTFPQTWDLTNALVTGLTISSVTARTFKGKVRPVDASDLTDFTETTSELVASSVVDSTGKKVTVDFNYPTTASYKNYKHTLILECTFSDSSEYPFFHYYIDVK